MKFLSSTEYLYPEKGGGEYALRNLLLELEEQGHETVALHNGDADPDIKDYTADIPDIPGGWTRNFLQSVLWGKKLSQVIDEEDPDYVVTQLGLAPVTQKVCEKKDVECIILLIDYSHLCMERFAGGKVEEHSCLRESNLKFKWQWPFYYSIKKNYEKALRKAEHVFSNSKFMKEKTSEFLDIETEVMYPPVDLESSYTEETGDKIGMVNSSKHKGGELLAKIAESSEEQFLVRGRPVDKELRKKLEELENVEFNGQVDDMSEYYTELKALLIPSQWPEPFGMIAPEAMYSKIPVMASKTGGLEEAVGLEELLVEEFENPDEWVNRVTELSFEKKGEYREHAEKFDQRKIVNKLLERIEK